MYYFWIWSLVNLWAGGGEPLENAFLGAEPSVEVPSLSPYSDWDLKETLAFVKRPGRAWVNLPWKTLSVTAYTDVPRIWNPTRYHGAMRLARWYLNRCRIRLPRVPLRTLPPRTLTQKGAFLRKFGKQVLLRKTRADETLLLFTRRVDYPIPNKPPIRLLGLSHPITVRDAKQKWVRRAAVWTRYSTVYTTLVHELGHRMGLKHVRIRYNLMLTGSGVRSSFPMLWTSMLGFFNLPRFRFEAWQCRTMHRVLQREQKNVTIRPSAS